MIGGPEISLKRRSNITDTSKGLCFQNLLCQIVQRNFHPFRFRHQQLLLTHPERESGIILLQYQHTKARNCRNHMGKSFSFPIISACIVRQKTFDHSNNLFFGQQLWNRTMLHAFYTNLSTAYKFVDLLTKDSSPISKSVSGSLIESTL